MAEDYDLPERLVTDTLLRDLKAGKIVASEVGATIPGIDAEKQPQFLLELVQEFGKGGLELETFFQAIAAAGLNGDISIDLMQAIWLVWLQPGVKQEELGELTKACVSKGKLSRRVVMELGEPELIVAAGQAPTKQGLDQRERKVFTATFYKQDKYNLLREENEGYSKLLSLLLSGGSLQQQHVPALTRDLKALIGAFKLDPNRVCELLLEAAERDEPGVAHWLSLMGLFNKKAPMEMLAMKFLHYQQDHSHLAAGEEEGGSAKQQQQQQQQPGTPPASLYNLAAAMIKAGQVTLEGVLSYISPSADSMAAAYKANFEALTEEVKQLGLVKLGDGKEAPAAGAAGGRVAALLTGNLDAIATERGITNDEKDDVYAAAGRRGAMSMASNMPPGGPMGMQQQQQMLPPGGPGGMWGGQRGGGMMPPPPQQQMGGMGGPGMSGVYGMQQQGMQQGNGPMGAQMRGSITVSGMGGGGMGGMIGGGGGAVGMSGGRGGGGGAAYSASYSVMPAAQLELDAHSMDRPLLDGSAGHLQLLAALMKAGDWEHALLMLDWMQSVLGIQAANDIAISTAMLAHLKRLLEPCYKTLYPRGPLGGNILHKPPYNLGPKGFTPGFSGDSLNPSPPPETLNPRGPELEPLGYKLLEHAGVYVYRDPEVLGMLLRVLQHELLFYGGMLPPEWQQQQQVNADKVVQVCKVLAEVGLPALSLNKANRGLAYELWEVLQLLPFHDRAEVYRQGLAACSACPPAAAAGQMAVKAFKKIKARLALPDKADKGRKDVVRANANLLSKVSHATPLQVADQVMWQAASFPNAVEPLAEVLKLPNPLTMDVLTYMALYWWGRLGRSKMKEDGANEEDWVSGVADLVGIACCSSKHNFKLHTLLPYLFDELRGGDTLAVLLLRSIIRKMTGVDGPANVDPSQASLLCCSTVMQAEAIHSVANREEPAFVWGRSTLLKVLTDGAPDQQLLVPLAVVMAQHLDWSLFTLHTQHLKELAEQHDRVNEICQQYIMMLEHCVLKDQEMDLRDYAAALPPLHVLVRQYRVHPGIAWMLWRPVVAALEPQLMARLEAQALAAAAEAAAAAAAAEEGEEGEAEALPGAAAAAAAAAAAGDGSSKGAAAAAADDEEGELPEEGEAMQGVEGAARASAAAAAVAAAASAAKLNLPVSLEDVEASVQQIDDALFKTLREPLYIAFWSLRPEEMHVPAETYEARIAEMEAFLRSSGKEATQLQNSIESDIRSRDRLTSQSQGQGQGQMYRGGGPRGDFDLNRVIDNLTAKQNQLAELEKKVAHYKAVLGPLRAERDALVARHRQVLQRLEAEKDTYMAQNRIVKPMAVAFIKHCLVPRLTRSLADATFCHHFTMALHTMDTPNWPAAFFWDYAVTGLTNMIPTVTEKEALCVGVFLTLLLQDLQVWYFDEQRYKRDCNQQTMKFSAQNATPATYQQFQKLFKKWQNELFKSLKGCAQGGEYLQKRNALLIMSKMIQAAPADKPPMFPVYTVHCEQMKEVMEEIQQKDAREDVKKMAQALAIQLSNKLGKCVPMPQEPGKGKLGARGAPVRGPLPKRKPPASPGKQPGSRPSTPPPAAAAAPAVKAEAGATDTPTAAEGAADAAAAADKPAAVKTEEGGKGAGKPATSGSAGATAAGPRAVRKGPAGSGPAGAGGAGTKAGAAAPKQQQQQGGNKPPRPASGDGEPARKRPRVTPPSSKAEGAAAVAAGEQEPGEVMESAEADGAAVAGGGGGGGASAGDGAGAEGGGGLKPKREAVPRPVKKAAVAAVAAAAAAAAADARCRKGGSEPKEDEHGHAKEQVDEQQQQRRQEDRMRHNTPDRGRGHHSHHAQQEEAATASPARGHRGERGASPGGKEQQQQQQQQQRQPHDRGGDRDRERDRGGGSRHHSRDGREQHDETATAAGGGKGGGKRRRGGSGSGGAAEKAAETPSQQQQREERDRTASKPRDRDKDSERDGTPGGEGSKEQQHGRGEKERDRKRDRREQKGGGDRQQQQQEDWRDKGGQGGGRDESSEPAKKRRLDDDRSADGSGREPQQQQPSRRQQQQDKDKQQQEQQLQRRGSKHTPIMAPADEAKGGRKDGGGGGAGGGGGGGAGGGHDRGGEERQHGGGGGRRR